MLQKGQDIEDHHLRESTTSTTIATTRGATYDAYATSTGTDALSRKVETNTATSEQHHVRSTGTNTSTNNSKIAIEKCFFSVEDLPNWWYSSAVGQWMSEQRPEIVAPAPAAAAAEDRHAYSSFLLKAAICRWPFVLQPLMSKSGSGVVSSGANWKKIFKFCGKFSRYVRSYALYTLYLINSFLAFVSSPCSSRYKKKSQ